MAPPPPVINPADRLSKLPEEIQGQILSFLPAQDAVRTCVLARTWRDVWKFTRRLLITAMSVQEAQQFVHHLLRVRLDRLEVACLDASEIRFKPLDRDLESNLDDEETSIINGWICRVLECQIQMLRIHKDTPGWYDGYLQMKNIPLLVSRHLTRLELTGVWFACGCLNLDGCPVLEHLEINECDLLGLRRIMSLSLKRLVITSCDSNYYETRIKIFVPRLLSLWLDNADSPIKEPVMTPLLERMPELVEAEVRIDAHMDKCDCDEPMVCYHVTRDVGTHIDYDSDDHEEGSGDYAGQNTTKCMVLEGLAQARDLVLKAAHPTYIFRRDLRWCPTFSKLKTLVLKDDLWWQAPDCSTLACILEHAPILENLTLFSCRWLTGKYEVQMKGQPDATMKSTKISQHLKTVEINCEDVNERFLNVLNFLGTLNIRFEIRVRKKNR